VVSRVTSALLVVPWAFAKQLVRPLLRGRVLAIALIAGICDATANMCYVLATHAGLLSLASVLTSLYPAVTVILAVALLHEHTSRVQRVGLTLAGVAVVLITV
jgi:drug/metabolite transporter (DMT)-like permease